MAENTVAWQPQIDVKKNQVIYIPLKSDDGRKSQADTISKITINGFTKIPTGFYKQGWGLTKPASRYLLPLLEQTFKNKKIELFFKEGQKFKVEKSGNIVSIYFDYKEYKTLLSELSSMNTENNKKIKLRLANSLSDWFPGTFNKFLPKIETTDYVPGDLNNFISKDKKLSRLLSEKDKDAILGLVNEFSEATSANIKPRVFNQQIGLVKNSKNISQKLYLQPVIKKFEAILKKGKQEESEWQDFFKAHLLDFNTNYHLLIDKQNVDIGIKIPDFLAVDNYNYIDVIEIKRPDTELLLFDKSHKTYYWSAEVAKAISQTENYIHALATGSDKIATYLRTRRGLDVRAVRPKGIMIIGANDQLLDAVKSESFRILNDSLKNITIVTFDDVLINLKSLISKIENKQPRKSRKAKR